MKNINELLRKVPGNLLQGKLEGEITELVYDSRKITDGCAFVCLKGASFDGHTFAAEAAAKGARLIVVEDDVDLSRAADASQTAGAGQTAVASQAADASQAAGQAGNLADVIVYKTENTRIALAELSAAYFDYPAEELKVIGITGTKGKTTSTFMVKAILEDAGHDVGLIGTIGTEIHGELVPSGNTTPESYVIQESFRKMLDAGCDVCVMEVSSQGLMMHRTDAIPFEIGVFTNITPDHIGPNEHASFEEYMACKALLFKQCKVGIFNYDDPHCADMMKDATCKKETFGINEGADLHAANLELEHTPGRLGIAFDMEGILEGHVDVAQPGRFSVYNALTAIAVARHFDVPYADIVKAMASIKVKGRIELVHVSDRFSIMIDYAHNAVALESLLGTLREYHPKRLVCIFGCGGNRSKLRRFEMGEVSGKLADLTIITSDNPRFEEPADIMSDIETAIKKTTGAYIKVEDRGEAVYQALKNAQDGDVIVLAGKGHEDYQEIKGVKHHMDETELIMAARERVLAEDGRI